MRSMLKDKRIQFALVLLVVEWVVVGGLALRGDDNPAIFGVALVIITWFQLSAILWRRKPSGKFADAQAAFMQGEYAQAVETLTAHLAEKPKDIKAQTLLGNTYRQMGHLVESESTLQQALAQKPSDAFPRYGLGRTLLAKGDFARAAQEIAQALQDGGRKVIQAELALAYYLDGNHEAATQTAKRAVRQLGLEPHRVLMLNYLLHRLQNDERAITMIQRNGESLGYWQAEAERFADTPYGQALQQELVHLQRLIDSSNLG